MRRFLLNNFRVGERNPNEKNHPAALTTVVKDLFILRRVSLNTMLIKFHLFKTSTATRSYGNNGAAAFSLLTQFKALVMKGGIYGDNPSCQCVGLLCPRARHMPRINRSRAAQTLSRFRIWRKSVFGEMHLVMGDTSVHTHLCVGTHLFHLYTLI